QDIAYFRFLSVDIELVNGEPKRMVITNDKPFTHHNYQVDSYDQEILFQKLTSGKIAIASKNTKIVGSKKNKPLEMMSSVKPVAIYEDKLG
ncbi:hypothetical protein OFO99_31855, partial [Escherichia coli]|nr:hypothetical protein [Escherichia coli]